MAIHLRKKWTLHWPITTGVTLIVLNVTLMVCWIVFFAQISWWAALTLGTIVFALVLIGLALYMALMIRVVRLNQRQSNFVDSVTHELKSPIATLRLYLETLELRALDDAQRTKFYRVMESELQRLDHLITQLLEVGRLDAIGQQSQPEDVALEPLLHRCAQAACAYHKRFEAEVVRYDIQPAVVHARGLVLETIFRNLIDNAIKYGAEPPHVEVQVRVNEKGRVVARIADNGEGVPPHLRKKIFQIFFRGGNELERRRKGTGLGLYIVHTLVRQLKGKVSVQDRQGGRGSVFEVELPGRILSCAS